MSRKSLEDRFWIKVRKTNTCWLWVASTNSKGYGQFRIDANTLVLAHRVSYSLVHRYFPIRNSDRKTDLDHTCRVRNCVNPKHLVPVSNRKNTQVGAASKLKKTKSSKYMGVCWESDRGKWKAAIYHNGRNINLGRFESELEAANAYASYLSSGVQ